MNLRKASYTLHDPTENAKEVINEFYTKKAYRIFSNKCWICDNPLKKLKLSRQKIKNSIFWDEFSLAFNDNNLPIKLNGFKEALIDWLYNFSDNFFDACSKHIQEDIHYVSLKLKLGENIVYSYLEKRIIYSFLYFQLLNITSQVGWKFPLIKTLNEGIKKDSIFDRNGQINPELIWFDDYEDGKLITYADHVTGLPLEFLNKLTLKEYIGNTKKQGELNGPDFIFNCGKNKTLGLEVFSVPFIDLKIFNNSQINSLKDKDKYSKKILDSYYDNFSTLEKLYIFTKKKYEEKVTNFEDGNYKKTDLFCVAIVLNDDIYKHWHYLLELLMNNDNLKYPFYVL